MFVRYIIILFFILISASTHAQKSKRSVKYRKLSFKDKEIFLLDKIKCAKESKDYETLEDWQLELKQLRTTHNFSAKDILKNGFFVDALLGIGFMNTSSSSTNAVRYAFMPAIRFGSKFYFLKKEKSTFGYNLIYLKPTIFYNPPSYNNLVSYSILNSGLTFLKVFKNNKLGIELSFNGGYNLLSTVQFDSSAHGFNINPNFNIRYRKLRFGLDLTSNFYFQQNNVLTINILSFNFGAKF